MPLPLTTVLADLPDPRRDTKNKIHPLTDILVIATCAVIAGAEGWEQIAAYGHSKEAFFRRFLKLPHGIPSHDTFNRVFAKLDPEAFADRFGRWAAGACEATGLGHVAIDGKSARRSPKGTFTGCLHLVEAWAVEGRLILGVRSVPEGGHEITTIPELVGSLDLDGAVVTIDAARDRRRGRPAEALSPRRSPASRWSGQEGHSASVVSPWAGCVSYHEQNPPLQGQTWTNIQL
jgi:hypothetical protein